MTTYTVDGQIASRQHASLTPILRLADRGSSAVCGLAVAVLATLLIATALGYRPLIDYSGSMRPAIQAGDLLITHTEPATKLRVGQIVSFIDQGLNGKLVTHRVVALQRTETTIGVVTRGDANAASETWSVMRKGSVGVLDFRVPAIGRVIAWTSSPWARIALLALVAFMISTMLLRRIWRA
jgi:signal peptidase